MFGPYTLSSLINKKEDLIHEIRAQLTSPKWSPGPFVKVEGWTCFSDVTPRVKSTKLEEKDVTPIVGRKNAEFMGHKGIWQNSQDK